MKRKHILTVLLLSIILVLAGILRLTGQNWDDFSYSHPDERFLNGTFTAICRWQQRIYQR